MTVTNVSGSTHRKDGRVLGSFVYMLLCQDDGPIYVKIGLSDNPYKRMQSLRNGCPVTPRRFATCAVPSRIVAKRVERSLINALASWRTQGEWFRFALEEKSAFNAGWQAGFRNAAVRGWPLEWTHIPVAELIKQWDLKRIYYQRRFKQSGTAYKDFLQHASCKS